LEKLLKQLRKQIRKDLERQGLSRRQADEALELDVRDLGLNVQARLRPPAEDSS
jgi:hypothetical protein